MTAAPTDNAAAAQDAPLKIPFGFRVKVLMLVCGMLLFSQSVFLVVYNRRNTENMHTTILSNLDTTVLCSSAC